MFFDVIFIAGPQGSGKGTQGKKLAEKLGFLFFGMGNVLREIETAGGPLAAKIAGVDKGTLLPDEVIIEILKARLPALVRERGLVFDGVPRRLGQAHFLVTRLREHGKTNMATVFIDLPREESMKRLLLRATNESRADDIPEAIERRFRYYDETMGPTIAFLKHETHFIQVDGRPSVEKIGNQINAALGL